MLTSRQRLYEYIRIHKTATTAELSRALNMSEANVRYHLSVLLSQDLVQISNLIHTRTKGRPAHQYRLSNSALGENFRMLSDLLLSICKQYLNENEFIFWLQSIAKSIYLNNNSVGNTKKEVHEEQLSKQLYDAVVFLNKLNYDARWEAHAYSPIIIFEHCPYRAIVDHHDEICRLDGFLLEEIINTGVKQTAKLKSDERGISYCSFRISES